MDLQSSVYRARDEYRRYFPDWTDRSLRVGEELEADHNSYLAGGYAEEFGYLAQAGSDRGVPLIDGVSPDDDALRLVQWTVLHPGYPLRPYPISVDREKAVRRHTLAGSSSGVPPPGEFAVGGHGKFVSIAERPYEREHRRLAHRLAAAVVRLLGAAVALRWELPALRKGP